VASGATVNLASPACTTAVAIAIVRIRRSPALAQSLRYLKSIDVNSNCHPGHYYLLNNYNPGYFGDCSNAYEDTNSNNTPFTIPPTSQRSIGDVLLEHNVSWKSYNDQWDAYLSDKYQLNLITARSVR